MSVDKTRTGKSPGRYRWLAFVISGMIAGFLGCLLYSHLKKVAHSFLSVADGNPKTDKPIVQTALTDTSDGQKDTVYATIADSTAATADVPNEEDLDWGVSLAVLSSDLRDSLRIPADIEGIVILSVTPGGLADEAGLQSGDVIVGVDNTPIASMNDFFAAITAGDDNVALLDIYSTGQFRFVALDSSAVAATARQSQTSLVDRIISIFTDDDNVILTEHINEEDDYEKPVCKRLEESGQRYEDEN